MIITASGGERGAPRRRRESRRLWRAEVFYAAGLAGFAYESSEASFPSGHVIFYVCYFGFLFFAAYALLPRGTFARRAALALSALPVLFVGVSRVYLRAHWPSDVLGAYLISGVWLAVSLAVYERDSEPDAPHRSEE